MTEEPVTTSPSTFPEPLPAETKKNGNAAEVGQSVSQIQNQDTECRESSETEEALGPEDINFAKEDIVLYAFCAILMIFLGAFFWTTQARLERNLLEDEGKNVSVPASAPKENEVLNFYRSYLQTQEVISGRRYRYGARILLTNSTRKNTGFMVGTMIALLGCIMVIRRIRKMPLTADFAASERAKLRVITSSPGVFVTLLGSLIILSTILRYDSFDLEDALVQPPGSFSISQPSPSPTALPSQTVLPSDNQSGNRPVLTNEEQKKMQELLKQENQILNGGQK